MYTVIYTVGNNSILIQIKLQLNGETKLVAEERDDGSSTHEVG